MATNTAVLNADGTLNEDFKNQLVSLINGAMETEEVQYSDVVKEYVEGQVNSLQNKLLNNEKWIEVQKNIDALLKVFDKDANGEITPAEVLAKFGELKNNIDKNAGDIANVAQKLEDNVKDLTAKTAANAEAIKGVKETVTALQTDVQNKIAEAKKASSDLVTAAKTELNGKVDTVSGKVDQVETKLENVNGMVNGSIDAIKGIAEAFETAAKQINVRMDKCRAVFGLDAKASTDTKTTSNDGKGDGAVV